MQPRLRRDRRRRRGALTAGLVAAALVLPGALACSGGDGDDAAGDGSATSTTGTPADDATSTTLSDDAFAAEYDELTERIDAVDDDLCAVVLVLVDGPQSEPATSEQVRDAVQAQLVVFRTLAATTPVDEANAPVIEAAADRLERAAEDAGYPVDLFRRPEIVGIVQDEAFAAAVQPYFERAIDECPEVAEQLGGTAGGTVGE